MNCPRYWLTNESIVVALKVDRESAADEEKGTQTLIQPRFRLNTDNTPEWGSVDAVPGTYRLHFDNGHSSFKVRVKHQDYELDERWRFGFCFQAKTLEFYVAVEEM